MMARLGDLIKLAKVIRCGTNQYPVLSMTMHDGIMLQSDRFKKSLASVNQSDYKVVNYGQLAVGFPIDEGVLYIQRVVPSGIMSPAYSVWDVNYDIVDPLYLELSLHSPQAMQYYKENLRGTTARRRSIPTDTLLALPLRLSSLEEQRKVVAVLDKVSDLIAKRRQQLDKLDELVKSRFIEMFGDPVANERRWPQQSMSAVAPAEAAKTHGIGKVWLLNLDMVEAQTGRVIDFVYVDAKEIGTSTCTFDTGNVLYSKLRPYLNKVVVPEQEGYCTTELVPLRPKKMLNRQFLAFLLRSDSFVSYINEKVAGAKMPRVSMGIFREFQCILPPIELQEQFAAFVTQIDKSKLAIQKSLEKLEILKKALMQKYFG